MRARSVIVIEDQLGEDGQKDVLAFKLRTPTRQLESYPDGIIYGTTGRPPAGIISGGNPLELYPGGTRWKHIQRSHGTPGVTQIDGYMPQIDGHMPEK